MDRRQRWEKWNEERKKVNKEKEKVKELYLKSFF